jgi:hypothetical protein
VALAAAQVIDAIAARLVPMTATGGRVYTSRAWPLAEASLPAWRVTADDEQVSPAAVTEPVNEHALDINARAFTRSVADLDDALHALAASGLALLFTAPVPHSLELQGIQRQLATEGEAAVGVITLRLRCTYWVNPATPETLYS